MLVTNQRREPEQSVADYLDWMVCVYKNHRHVERRMRNLKSDLPIRPIYLHRDDAIVALCFVSVVALMIYTLIERDCQAHPVLVEAGVRTTDQVWATLHGFCLTVYLSPSGYQVFWLDTPTESQTLIWRQLQLLDPGTRVPIVRPAPQEADSTENPISFLPRKRPTGAYWSLWLTCLWLQFFKSAFVGCVPHPCFGLVRCSLESYLFCYAENEL